LSVRTRADVILTLWDALVIFFLLLMFAPGAGRR